MSKEIQPMTYELLEKITQVVFLLMAFGMMIFANYDVYKEYKRNKNNKT